MSDLVTDRGFEPGHPLPESSSAGAVRPPRILVVDADERTRESIAGLLAIRHRFDVVGTTGQVGDALALAEAHRPDVVIVDPRLPEVSGGVALIRGIHAIDRSIRILAVGWSPELENATLAAGATCFIRKTFKPGDLASAVGRCMAEPDLEGEVPTRPATPLE